MQLLKAEREERDFKGNSPSGGNLRPSQEYACSGYASVSSPIKSSWVQRLIPAQITRAEQPQFSNSLPIRRKGFDGLQADWSCNAVFKSDSGKHTGFALYKNSRSRQILSSSHEILFSENTTCNEQIGVIAPCTRRTCDSSEILQPNIQVPPRTLPVVESILTPGCSKQVMEAQLSMETHKLHNLSKWSGFSNPIKQTVHFSADETSRVSCSSIGGLNLRSSRCVPRDFNASILGHKYVSASQPTSEYSFNYPEAVVRSNVDSIYGGVQAQTCTHSGMDFTNGQQAGEATNSGNRTPVSMAGLPSIERRHRSDRCLMPYNSRVMDSFPECFIQEKLSSTRTIEDLHVDQKNIHTMSNRNRELSQEHQDYAKGAIFAFEVSCGMGGAFTGGGKTGLGKYGCQRVSGLVSSQYEANIRERTSISLAPCVVERELGLSGDSYKEQDDTSGSFSFHSNGRLPYVSVDAKGSIERGHWPFCETSPYIEHLVQRGLPEDHRTRDSVETSRMPLNYLSSIQPEVDNAYINGSHCSPFFQTDTLMELGRHRLASKHDILPHKLTCMDSKGIYIGESHTEGLDYHGVIQDAGLEQEKGRQLNDGIAFSRVQSKLVIEGAERKEEFIHPPEAISKINWEGVKAPFKVSTESVGSIESCSKRPADLGIQDLATNAQARNTLTVSEGPTAPPSVCFGEDSHSFSTGSGLHKALDGSKSEERGARIWDNGSVLRQNMWLKRWSTTIPQEERTLRKVTLNRERSFVNNRCLVENDYSLSQSSWESSHRFDLRPAKRACYGQRFGLHSEPCQAIPVLGSIAFGRENQQGIRVTSHSMKRFLTPSAAAMAVMGMTARKVHATQPQRKGRFGVWSVISTTKEPVKGQVKIGKEFLTRQKDSKGFLHSSVELPSTQVDT